MANRENAPSRRNSSPIPVAGGKAGRYLRPHTIPEGRPGGKESYFAGEVEERKLIEQLPSYTVTELRQRLRPSQRSKLRKYLARLSQYSEGRAKQAVRDQMVYGLLSDLSASFGPYGHDIDEGIARLMVREMERDEDIDADATRAMTSLTVRQHYTSQSAEDGDDEGEDEERDANEYLDDPYGESASTEVGRTAHRRRERLASSEPELQFKMDDL